ncbi:MAG: YafY family transcriptional regulator [Pedobacter sp.]|nr:MAG: YafY family transcriptional regulator [Pedobacter sp.]
MNRIDRLHAILTHLQSKKKVTAQDIADRFNISLRTVYRDVKALEESGVPVIGEAGIGYSVMEGYRLPPVMFTREEASALIMGAKLAEQFTDQSIRKHFDGALFKIKAVLRGSDKDYVDQLTSHIHINERKFALGDEFGQQHLSNIQHAIVNKKCVKISYLSTYKEELTTRIIQPIGLYYYGNCWHLIAWCALRNDYRDFRVDKISVMVITDECFDGSLHPSLKEYIDQIQSRAQMYEAVVIFDKDVAKQIKSYKYYFGFVSEEESDDKVKMKFLTSCLDSFGRWLISYTNAVSIVSPDSLHEKMVRYTDELRDHYSEEALLLQ